MRRKSAKLIWASKSSKGIFNKFDTKCDTNTCTRNNDKHLVKIPFEGIADEDGQDMVDMDKLYIHIIDTLICFLIVS